jgi:NAD(P)-dependent dehydrogenase (short-subunit alcohol dehydrogenase family)
MTASTDRLALVTGTSAGIGAAVARRLLGRGWAVVGVARRAAAIDDERYTHLSLDLGDEATAFTTIGRALSPLVADRRFHRIGLVNNAALGGQLGPTEKLQAAELLAMYAVNVAAPIRLMGLLVSASHADASLRIVNVSSGAAVHAVPGLAAYGSSKAALRMAGMVLAAELDSPLRPGVPRRDAAIVSYEPGAVETAMQVNARSLSRDEFPWVDMFHRFQSSGVLVAPEAPAAEIVSLLEADALPRFSERRLGQRGETLHH